MRSGASSFIAEGFAREVVPDARLGGGHRVFFIVAGALCGLPAFVLSAQVAKGLGFARAREAFLLGGLLSGVLGGLSAYAGAHTRMNLAMLADEAFGSAGGRLVKTVIAVTLVGWVGVILSVLGATAGNALHSIYGVAVESQWIAIAAAAAVTGIALRGVRGLEHIGMVIGPLLCALLAWTLFKGCPPGAAPAAAVPAVPASLGFGAAVSAVVGEYVVGIVIQPDYGRFVRRPVRAGIASALALGVAFPCILIGSSIPTLRCSATDLIGAMVAAGIGLPALALVVLGAWTDASACLYSGSLSLTNEVRRFSLPWVTVSSAGVGCLFAVFHAERHFMPFLAILGITFPPVAAVNILNVFWNSGIGIGEYRSARPAPIRWTGVLAWAGGSIAGYLSANGDVNVSGIASIDSVLATAAIWLSMSLAARAGALRGLKSGH